MKIFWDIETEGLEDSELEKVMPEFEAGANVKDLVKIANAIEEKKAAWKDKAALKAITGKIVAITIAKGSQEPEMHIGKEPDLIYHALEYLTMGTSYSWNGHNFDLPFLCQRAAVHNIPAFGQLMIRVRGKFYWRENLIDAKQVWSNYSPDISGSSLKSVAMALGVGEKVGSGKDFAALLKTNRAEAERYALADVTLLRDVVNRMGI